VKKLVMFATGAWMACVVSAGLTGGIRLEASPQAGSHADSIDAQLAAVLAQAGFTGTIGSQVEARLGRPIDRTLAELGRVLWFDKLHSLRQDNSCAGCHSPSHTFGDSQSIAIGIQNNDIVGPRRFGPRNQRRSPPVVNSAFYPALMWNGRFHAPSGDPFDNSLGFTFPTPEGSTAFPSGDPVIRHLLQAQAHIPPTELVEVAGFAGTAGTIGSRFDQFDDGLGVTVPPPDDSGFRNEPIRQKVLELLNGSQAYRQLFGQSFPAVATGAPIDFSMFGRAIAEFEFTLVFANAPLDRFARGDWRAMTAGQKRGALLFFGKAGCVTCHAVGGYANEMFSDFQNHVVGVPQIAPFFGGVQGNIIFDGPGEDEDFGLEQVTFEPSHRYMFRTAPLRNLAFVPAFFHNGAFTTLEDAIRHHLSVYDSARSYDARTAGVALDLRYRLGPIEPVLERLDARLQASVRLDTREFNELVAFVRDGLLDPRASPQQLCRLIPAQVPSGLPLAKFQGCD
jgi:cytochrome c peroxidase